MSNKHKPSKPVAPTTPPPRLAPREPRPPFRPTPPPPFVTGDLGPATTDKELTSALGEPPVPAPKPVEPPPTAPVVRASSDPVPPPPEPETVTAPDGPVHRANCDPPSKT
jgi:periplasmic protein TonB